MRRHYGKASQATDDAMLVELAGYPVEVVDGDYRKYQDHDQRGSADRESGTRNRI